MLVKDFIAKKLYEYPSLFKDVNYELSKLKIFNNVFNNSCYDFAYTIYKDDGGYLTKPKFKRIKDEKIRKYDKDYGKEKYRELIKDFFECQIFSIGYTDYKNKIYSKNEESGKVEISYIRTKEDRFKFSGVPFLSLQENRKPYIPQRIKKDNSIINEIINETKFLQEDWLEELINYCKANHNYYKKDKSKPSDPENPLYYYFIRLRDVFTINTDIDVFKEWEDLKVEQLNLLSHFIGKLTIVYNKLYK